jgi:membrane associated rhomboid family serine protease
MSRPTPVTYTIMALAIGVHVGRFLLPDVFDPLVTDMAQANWLVAAGEWWRLLTAAFLHADAMHLLFNMWALYIFGPQLERELGGVTFTSLYLASAATGGAAAYFLGGDFDVLVGASGAIFGLFGVWLVGSWRIRHTRAGSALYRQLIVLLAINAALPLFARNISWQGHLGGLAAGALMAFAWARIPADRRRGPLRTVIATAIGLVAIFFTVLL